MSTDETDVMENHGKNMSNGYFRDGWPIRDGFMYNIVCNTCYLSQVRYDTIFMLKLLKVKKIIKN